MFVQSPIQVLTKVNIAWFQWSHSHLPARYYMKSGMEGLRLCQKIDIKFKFYFARAAHFFFS